MITLNIIKLYLLKSYNLHDDFLEHGFYLMLNSAKLAIAQKPVKRGKCTTRLQ